MSDQVHETAEPAGDAPRKVRFARTRRLLSKIPYPPLRTKRGMFLTFFLVAGFGSVITIVGVMGVGFTETAAFCGLCHTMNPEQKAYKTSSHSELACAECHVEPGMMGWVKAKAAGTKQLVQLVTNTYPKPIPPPDHDDLPSVTETCMRCHSLETITANGGPVKLVLRPTYAQDKANTRALVAVVLRPVGLTTNEDGSPTSNTPDAGPRGVHWHVEQKVTFTSSDPRSQTIDSVEFTDSSGKVVDYVAADKIGISTDVAPDIKKLQATDMVRTMDCITCHNRAGHGQPTTSQAMDNALSAGDINPNIPYIKKNGLVLLDADYATLADANQAIDGLTATYETSYPAAATKFATDIDEAIVEIKKIYAELATPEMKVQAATYPDNLGHQAGPGCFRCHDGAHFKVVDGKATNETIPSTCSTCHTFPQVGANITGLLLGGEPTSHKAPLWVFDHKSAAAAVASQRNAQMAKLPAGSMQPAGTTCGTCHQRSYCEDCHTTGAIKVKHDEMLYNHAASIKVSGGAACAYCHQPVFCARCHADNVLGTPAKKNTTTGTS
jgi:nitrate/TMAO reductase-like tetraheme cytochrome c subunit